METRHPAGVPFGREFSEFVIIADLWWPEVARPGNFLSNVCVFWKKRFLSNCHYCADRAQNLPGLAPPPPTFGSHCSRSHPNRFTFGGVIAERIKTVLLHRVFTIYYLRAYNNNNADIDSRFVFEPIAVETLGVLNSSARLLLSDLGRRITNISGEARELSFLFQRVSVLVQLSTPFCCTTVCRPLIAQIDRSTYLYFVFPIF